LKAFIRVLILIFRRIRNSRARKFTYFDPELNETYVPYVIETSIGLGPYFPGLAEAMPIPRRSWMTGSERVVLRLPAILAPIKCGILPLIAKGWPA